MFIHKITLLVIDTFICCSLLEAQRNLSVDKISLLETFNLEEEITSENEREDIEELKRDNFQCFDINKASREQLERLSFLTAKQVESILAYVYQHPLQSVYELQLIDNLDYYTINKLVQVIVVNKINKIQQKESIRSLLKQTRQEIASRLSYPLYTRVGYKNKFLGLPWYSNIRYALRAGHKIEWGFIVEKEEGEPFFALKNRKGYDYVSFYVMFHNWKWIKDLVVGNYKLNLGEGLIIGSNGFLHHYLPAFIYPSLSGEIKKHQSNDEYHYLSGFAATFQWKKIVDITPFYSLRKLDAKIVNNHIKTIYKGGKHCTTTDFQNRHKAHQQLVGMNLNFLLPHLKLGLTALSIVYNYPLLRKKELYNRYNPQGNAFYNLGVHYQYFWRNLRLRGEIAKGKKGIASLNYLLYHAKPNLDFLLLHRYYSFDYWGLLSQSYGVSQRTQNENGWAFLCLYMPSYHYTFNLSFDLYSLPGCSYRISKPSKGCIAKLSLSKRTPLMNYSFKYSFKRKERDVAHTKGKQTIPFQQHHWGLTAVYKFHCGELKSQVSGVSFKQSTLKKSRGYQLTECCKLTFNPLSITCQGTYFHSLDSDSRLSIYEPNVLYSYGFQSFIGRGYRMGLLVRYEASEHLLLMTKWSCTHYFDREKIGVGIYEIPQREKMDLHFFIRLKF